MLHYKKEQEIINHLITQASSFFLYQELPEYWWCYEWLDVYQFCEKFPGQSFECWEGKAIFECIESHACHTLELIKQCEGNLENLAPKKYGVLDLKKTYQKLKSHSTMLVSTPQEKVIVYDEAKELVEYRAILYKKVLFSSEKSDFVGFDHLAGAKELLKQSNSICEIKLVYSQKLQQYLVLEKVVDFAEGQTLTALLGQAWLEFLTEDEAPILEVKKSVKADPLAIA